MKLHDFLVEHAKFPFPDPVDDRTVGTTDISEFEVGLLKREWKTVRAVRDDTLVQKLCRALNNILEDTPLVADAEDFLLASFVPRLQFERGRENREWKRNSSKAHVSFERLNSGSSFVLTSGTESDIVRCRVLSSHPQVFRRMWSV
jgi:hypothetical protein